MKGEIFYWFLLLVLFWDGGRQHWGARMLRREVDGGQHELAGRLTAGVLVCRSTVPARLPLPLPPAAAAMRWRTPGWSPPRACSLARCRPSRCRAGHRRRCQARRAYSLRASHLRFLCPALCTLLANSTRRPTFKTLQAPDEPTYIELEFERGDPVALNGVNLSPAAMLAKLNELGGNNGGQGRAAQCGQAGG